MTRLPRVPFRLFYATLSVAHREVSQSAFFNPLVALEFRPEFDRITNVARARADAAGAGRAGAPARRAHVPLALPHAPLRHAARARRARAAAGRRSSTSCSACSAPTRARSPTTCASRRASCSPTASSASSSRSRRADRRALRRAARRGASPRSRSRRRSAASPRTSGSSCAARSSTTSAPPTARATSEQLRASVATVGGNLRPALQNAVLVLGKALGARLDEHGVFDDVAARRSLSMRLRRDVWMFAQIVRAFGARRARRRAARIAGAARRRSSSCASSSRTSARWATRCSAPPTTRASTRSSRALTALEETDLLDPARLERAVARGGALLRLPLASSSSRSASATSCKGVPFDRRRRRRSAQALPRRLADPAYGTVRPHTTSQAFGCSPEPA